MRLILEVEKKSLQEKKTTVINKKEKHIFMGMI